MYIREMQEYNSSSFGLRTYVDTYTRKRDHHRWCCGVFTFNSGSSSAKLLRFDSKNLFDFFKVIFIVIATLCDPY
ncbi:hypothetical protein E1A91_D12G150700v1 [Gossypium mustelinum]|uniref:Uncharacterized protein n=1 Tax=Gossypium mustelinum TaxID=34275 RepID=A0A5D2SEQ1_GOSMU|nr:hypothetical protein E1A91_D12G150700v1 [Gossypium mustelinum]